MEDENCNGDMESMEMDMDADGAVDGAVVDTPATAAESDVSCCDCPSLVTSSAQTSLSSSTSAAVNNLCWFV